jgi:hypothetical protein
MLKTEVINFDLVGNRLIPCKPFYCTWIYSWFYVKDEYTGYMKRRYVELPVGYAEAIDLQDKPRIK